MKHLKLLFAAILINTFMTSQVAATPVKFEFFQDGFYSYDFDQNGLPLQGSLTNASISGFFTGKDRNGDGQIYARSRLASDFGLGPFGNELLFGEITFNGFGTSAGSQTIVFNSKGTDPFGERSDMNSLFSAFIGIAYNLDGGPLGDTADEGLSFSLFAPSTNFSLGSAFAPYWASPEYFNSEITGICDNINACGLVFEALPAQTPSGAEAITPFFLSTEALQIEQVDVSTPPIFGLYASLIGGLLMLKRQRKHC